MPSLRTAGKKRTRQTNGNGSAKRRAAGNLSLDFMQDLVDESLAANGIVKDGSEEEPSSDAEADFSGDENEEAYGSSHEP